MNSTTVYTQHEYRTCIHVGVQGARNERSAVQLARNYASRHYGMPVGHHVSSGCTMTLPTGWDYTYIYSAPDLVKYRDLIEVHEIERGRTVGVTVYPVRMLDQARAFVDGINLTRGTRVADIRQVVEYQRAASVLPTYVNLVKVA